VKEAFDLGVADGSSRFKSSLGRGCWKGTGVIFGPGEREKKLRRTSEMCFFHDLIDQKGNAGKRNGVRNRRLSGLNWVHEGLGHGKGRRGTGRGVRALDASRC